MIGFCRPSVPPLALLLLLSFFLLLLLKYAFVFRHVPTRVQTSPVLLVVPDEKIPRTQIIIQNVTQRVVQRKGSSSSSSSSSSLSPLLKTNFLENNSESSSLFLPLLGGGGGGGGAFSSSSSSSSSPRLFMIACARYCSVLFLRGYLEINFIIIIITPPPPPPLTIGRSIFDETVAA